MSEEATICIECGGECTAENPVCCDHSFEVLPDGTTKHVDPICRRCCAPHHPVFPIWDGKASGGGNFWRNE